MTKGRKLAFQAAVMVFVAAFVLLIWPTPYRYDRIEWTQGRSVPVRTNRITAKAEWLLPATGWVHDPSRTHRGEAGKQRWMLLISTLLMCCSYGGNQQVT
jgi:hypothetical protein